MRAIRGLDIVAHKGGNVQYHDPHIPTIKISASFPPQGKMSAYGMRGADKRGISTVQTHYNASLKSIPLTAETLEKADVVVLTTNHKAFDVEFIQKHAQMDVDMRNMIKDSGDKVYKLNTK